MDPDNRSEGSSSSDDSEGISCADVCKKVLKFIFANFGILVLNIAYIVLGGYLFTYLEVDNEINSCKDLSGKYKLQLNTSTERIYSISTSGYNETKAKQELLAVMQTFATEVYTLQVDPEMDCETIGEPDNQPSWNLLNAAFFCSTIVTTIGYGHISPNTQWGKIVCIVYSVIGIPLMLLFLTRIGDVMATIFRGMYINLCCCKCFIRKSKESSRPPDNEIEPDGSDWTTPSNDFDHNGDIKKPPPKMGPVVVVEEDDMDDEEEMDEDLTIPLTITLTVIVFYVLMGALLFQLWEEWDLVDGTYFAFITFSTIGFGDLYPGHNGFKEDTLVEIAVGSMFNVCGLAMLSMCINLLQDEIAAKFVWLSAKFGLKHDEEEPKNAVAQSTTTLVEPLTHIDNDEDDELPRPPTKTHVSSV